MQLLVSTFVDMYQVITLGKNQQCLQVSMHAHVREREREREVNGVLSPPLKKHTCKEAQTVYEEEYCSLYPWRLQTPKNP